MEADELVYYESAEISFDLYDTDEVKTSYGLGLFSLSNKRLRFQNQEGTWELLYQEIGMHALSRDPANFGAPCIYCQPASEEVIQWVFTPSDPQELEKMFEALTRCSSMAPGSESDEELYTSDNLEEHSS